MQSPLGLLLQMNDTLSTVTHDNALNDSVTFFQTQIIGDKSVVRISLLGADP